MQADSNTTKAVKNVLKQMSKAYAKRDLDLMRSITDDDMFVFGTGPDEVARGASAVLTIVQRDWSQSDSTQIEFTNTHVYSAGDVAWCDTEAEFTVSADGHTMHVPSRATIVLRRRGDKWLTIQGHFSLPASNQPEGSAFPGAPQLVSR